MTAFIEHEVDLDLLAHQLVDHNDLSHEELLDFIKAIDEGMVDWDFTEKCYDYFAAEMEEKKREQESPDAPILGAGSGVFDEFKQFMSVLYNMDEDSISALNIF